MLGEFDSFPGTFRAVRHVMDVLGEVVDPVRFSKFDLVFEYLFLRLGSVVF